MSLKRATFLAVTMLITTALPALGQDNLKPVKIITAEAGSGTVTRQFFLAVSWPGKLSI